MPINIYHCCVFKTGSQWMRAVLEHPFTRKASGMECYRYEDDLPGKADPRRIRERFFDAPFPKNKILSPLFIDFEGFQSIPKPSDYRAFFVARDPRDIVVSWYFSALYSHKANERMSATRKRLQDMSLEAGLIESIRVLNNTGTFGAILSWNNASKKDPNTKVISFENLTGARQLDEFRDLFEHCQIKMKEKDIKKLLADLSFKELSGRHQGNEDKNSHYRKGISGDWKNYFKPEVNKKFSDLTGNLIIALGYQ